MTFTDQILADVAPWADSKGFWNTYNAALASMYETVFGLVADLGDVSQTIVGTLSAGLSAGSPVTTIAVQAISQTLPVGQSITVAYASSNQDFAVSQTANPGDIGIHVQPDTANFSYPVGTPVQLDYVPGWSILLDPDDCPAQFLPFLAQFNGTNTPVGLDAATARMKITNESAQQRGTLAAVTAAIQRNETGTSLVSIIERKDSTGATNEYFFTAVVPTSQAANAQAIKDAITATKPGGVQFALVLSDAFIWNQAIHTWAADTMSWDQTTSSQP